MSIGATAGEARGGNPPTAFGAWLASSPATWPVEAIEAATAEVDNQA